MKNTAFLFFELVFLHIVSFICSIGVWEMPALLASKMLLKNNFTKLLKAFMIFAFKKYNKQWNSIYSILLQFINRKCHQQIDLLSIDKLTHLQKEFLVFCYSINFVHRISFDNKGFECTILWICPNPLKH